MMNKKVILVDENNVDELVALIKAVENEDDQTADSILKHLADTSAVKDLDDEQLAALTDTYECDDDYEDDDEFDDDDEDFGDELTDIFNLGLVSGLEIARKINAMPVGKRREIFDSMNLDTILAGSLENVEKLIAWENGTTPFNEGDIVLFDGEKCRVMADDGNGNVQLMDNQFHTFEAARDELKKLA